MAYVGTKEGIYKSQDGARSWDRVGEGLSNIATLVIHPETRVLYAGSNEGKIFKSSDGGIHFKVMSDE